MKVKLDNDTVIDTDCIEAIRRTYPWGADGEWLLFIFHGGQVSSCSEKAWDIFNNWIPKPPEVWITYNCNPPKG